MALQTSLPASVLAQAFHAAYASFCAKLQDINLPLCLKKFPFGYTIETIFNFEFIMPKTLSS